MNIRIANWPNRGENDFAMAARTNRPRPGPSREDPAAAQEETSMWNQILADLKICKGLNDRATALSKEVVEVEASMGIGRFFSEGSLKLCCYGDYLANHGSNI